MKRKLLSVAVSCALTSVLVAGCGSDTANAAFGVDYPRSDTDFWNSYIKFVPLYSVQLGMQLKTTNSHNDVTALAGNVERLVSQGVKAILMAPQDTAGVTPTLDDLAAKKIPVVSVDTRPDKGQVYMVVRADNKAYGEKACDYLGTQLKGKGKVAEFEGALDSINGRDRSEAFASCMKTKYPDIKVIALATDWQGDTASAKLQTTLASDPDLNGIYMQAGGVFLQPTLAVLQQKGLLKPAGTAGHITIISNDGIPEEFKAIKSGEIDATISQPADTYAKYALYYAKEAMAGKTFKPGPTDHNSNIIKIPNGLEDQLPAPLVTKANVNDPSLWANQLGKS